MDNPSNTPETAAVSPRITPAKVPVIAVQYLGKNGAVFRLHILNLLMNIITLGIYSFWGKTRIRKYMTSHIVVAKERLEYTGTGGELLIGWLKAMVIFVPLFICLYIPIVNFVAIIGFMTILSVAIYLALRYRLSRTKWRGIKFSLAGSIKEYFVLALKRTVINIFTLGFKIPKSDIMLWSYITNNMSYGDLKFSYQGDHTRLRKIHLITLGIILAGVVVPTAGMTAWTASKYLMGTGDSAVPISNYQNTDVQQVAPQAGEDLSAPSETPSENEVVPYSSQSTHRDSDPSGLAGYILLLYAGIGMAITSRMWYHAALWQERFRGLRLANLRFKLDITGMGLAKLFISNLFLIMITLGLARPIAANRTLRYYASNLRIGGDLAELLAKQDKTKAQSGMGDALAADVGFDLGL